MSRGGSAISVAPSDVDGGSEVSRRQFRWVQRGVSFSGRERHCCFLNLGQGRFADVSAPSGLDYTDDGRAVGLVDWDQDGDVDIWIANRNGPQLRFFRNDFRGGHHYVALRLAGRACNRDAVGARVELKLAGTRPTTLARTLRAGDGYLAQSSKWIHFGLGGQTEIVELAVKWPGGGRERISGVKADGRYRIVQGTGRAEPEGAVRREIAMRPSSPTVPPSSDLAELTLASPFPLPRLPYTTVEGQPAAITTRADRPVLVNLWASWCQPCIAELSEFANASQRVAAVVDVLALSVDGLGDDAGSRSAALEVRDRLRLPFFTGFATDELLNKLTLADQVLFDIHMPMPVPTSFLINPRGELAAVYKGPVSVERILKDVGNIGKDGESLRSLSLPLPGRWYEPRLRARLLPLAWDLIQAGYLDDGLEYVARTQSWLKGDPEYPKLLALTGYELLERGDVGRAAEQYRAAIREDPRTTVAHLNLGVALIRQGQYHAALSQYHEALKYSPRDPRIYYTIAWLLATAPDASVRNGSEAIRWAQRAALATGFKHFPALEALGAAYAEAGQFDQAVAETRGALRVARESGDNDAVKRIEERLKLFEHGQPYHEKAESHDD